MRQYCSLLVSLMFHMMASLGYLVVVVVQHVEVRWEGCSRGHCYPGLRMLVDSWIKSAEPDLEEYVHRKSLSLLPRRLLGV